VYAPFRAADLLQGTLAPAQLETVGLAVYDGEDPVDGALLYDAGVPAATGEVRTERIEVAGRSWTLRYAAAEGFAGPAERILPLAVLAAGLALSVLLWWLTRREARARARAEVSARRCAFLAEAGKTLASSLAYRETLARVAELATREVADGCVVEVDDPDAPIRAAAARPGVRTRASLSVPLVARGARLGAITLSSRRRRLPREDAALAEDLARLAVAAIDTARLYWQAQDAVRERDEFLSVASHELKTPLTSLALQADSLRVSARRGQHEQVLRKVEVVRRNVERLARLVASLLDLSRIRAGRLELEIEDVDLADVAREVVERFQDEAERAGCEISLTAQGPVVGRWDPLRLDQVITNLLANAVKYGPGKPIEIRVEASRAAATVQITDHGIGIPAADLGRIFERFERAVSKRNYGGFGLGLWIVRQVVEAFGGTVRAESTPGDGATFTVELPRAVQPRPVTVVEAAPPERGPASGGEAPS
jgi:signal transduction histidine kinase